MVVAGAPNAPVSTLDIVEPHCKCFLRVVRLFAHSCYALQEACARAEAYVRVNRNILPLLQALAPLLSSSILYH